MMTRQKLKAEHGNRFYKSDDEIVTNYVVPTIGYMYSYCTVIRTIFCQNFNCLTLSCKRPCCITDVEAQVFGIHLTMHSQCLIYISDFIWLFLRLYMGVIPNPKLAFIFPISCI